jgi:hypothetical protein
MSAKGNYFIYILEKYKLQKHINGKEALKIFQNNGIIGYIWATYDAMHTMGDKFALDDIDEIISQKAVVA